MIEAVRTIGLPEVIAALMLAGLTAYAITGGADFGGGVWDLLARGPRRESQRKLIASALAPIWEANHVWLIVVVVVLFTAFPAAFATIAIALHVPLTVLLVGIVLRGSAFVFRAYGSSGHTSAQQRWGRVFAIASVVTPVFLGIVVGALASGAVGAQSRALADTPDRSFGANYIAPWLTPFPLAVGLFALALFAYLAAVYLALAAGDEGVREDFRRRALAAAIVSAMVALAVRWLAARDAPRMESGFRTSVWAIPLQLSAVVAALTAFTAVWQRRWQLARLAAAAEVSLVLWGWALAQYPYIVPHTLTIRDAAAPRPTLEVLALTFVIGGAVLLPSLIYLMRTFAGHAENQEVETR